MPKFPLNEKAVAGRARQEEKKQAQKRLQQEKKAQLEELSWKEGAKDDSKKKAAQDKKLQKLASKAELKALQEKEDADLTSKYCKPVVKLSKTKLSEADSFALKASKASSSNSSLNTYNSFLASSSSSIASASSEALGVHVKNDENLNVKKGSSKLNELESFSASNIDDALFILDAVSPVSANASGLSLDRHPERRVKAAFRAYEEEMMPQLKAENPSLKHSQLLEILAKNWKKSPKNPFNQAFVAYDTSKENVKRISEKKVAEKLDSLRL